MINIVSPSVLQFLVQLKQNNNRDWFTANKTTFIHENEKLKQFYNTVLENLKEHDNIERMKMYRIYRDIRFSNDKTPYKTYLDVSFSRATNSLRGGYYLRISPNDCMVAGGFWKPEKEDLYRIRKEFELDAYDINKVISNKNFKKYFGKLEGESLKTAPRGFNKNHPNIDLIKKKQFLVIRKFKNEEVLHFNFINEVDATFKAMRPFFNLMSDILTTNLNGESILD